MYKYLGVLTDISDSTRPACSTWNLAGVNNPAGLGRNITVTGKKNSHQILPANLQFRERPIEENNKAH